MQQHLKDQLAELRLCLAALPADIPIPKESKYKFLNFSPDAEWAADIGEAAAINRELEKFPGDVILEKWVDDTLEAARGLILATGKASIILRYLGNESLRFRSSNTHILSTFDDDRYISAGEDEDSRKGGAKMHPLLRKQVVPLGKNLFGALPAVAVTSPGHGQELGNSQHTHTLKQPVAPTVAPSVKWRDICSDSDAEAGDWLDNGDIADHVGLAGVKSTEFNVGKDIDLSSTYLLNILSDHTVQPTVACGGLLTPKVMADQATTSSLTSMDDEWEKW
ncbi:uncharacterized protein EDB91DRAFT_1294948 [Suillus paluster]|uniref:uncharacterized protein n=1 Tax=Suillus paluster TaxID=48578 RepID=UPI001B882FC3|nr:uncharacterized protein EDB91DRAFT_1294948 [Suillus paluster]KAG1735678.1 hypothetical protein EDB91DRAFT_1294948 [Suillus paluster]